MSKTIEEQLKYDEGCKLQMYRDTEGYWTVGIGHLIVRDNTISKVRAIEILSRELLSPIAPDGRITASEASYLFQKDLAAVKQGIESSSFYAVYRGLDSERKGSIQNMVFQMGVRGVANFKRMWAAIAVGNWNEAYRQGLDSTWFKQTPNRARRVMETLRTGSTQHYPTK
ncbi:glycoside hydrolase family protein [Aeromonas veronii]|uniref:glycoside hydrolase family protein n=1 Tax=Aeromonas veronii TaxID=654 RepID=UPI0032EF02B0